MYLYIVSVYDISAGYKFYQVGVMWGPRLSTEEASGNSNGEGVTTFPTPPLDSNKTYPLFFLQKWHQKTIIKENFILDYDFIFSTHKFLSALDQDTCVELCSEPSFQYWGLMLDLLC